MDLARRGQTVERPIDLMKSPVVLDFLDLPESELLRESDLESAILSKLSQFLLEGDVPWLVEFGGGRMISNWSSLRDATVAG